MMKQINLNLNIQLEFTSHAKGITWQNNTLAQELQDAHALVTFNSNASVESILLGVPVFTLAPNAAQPVSLQDISKIETPYYPDQDKLYAWASSLAYGQFHNQELKNGIAIKILLES